MPTSRKLLIGAGALFALLVVALLLIPFFFGDRVAGRLKAAIDDSVNARVEWGGVGLSVVRNFPHATLTLDRLSIVGRAPFDHDTLLSLPQARLVLDVGSVIGYLRSGRPIVVRAVSLQAPAVKLRVLADGTTNWDIARKKSGATSDTARSVAVTLRDLRISDGRVTLDDQHSHLAAAIVGLEETLRGDFSQSRFVLTTQTRADSVSLRFAGIPYLARVGVGLDAKVDADMRAHRFTVTGASLRLNQLALAFAGAVALDTPNVVLNLTFSTPSTAFRDILSMVPAIYAREFAQLQTSGTMSASGSVRGAYGPHAFPALTLHAQVDRGAFRYPSLPLAASDISMDLAIDNPGGTLDNTVVNLKRFHAVLGGRPLDARLVMRTPVSDPDVDLRLAGTLNLADVARTVKLEGVSQLTGMVAADVLIRARMSDVDARRLDKITAAGSATASRVALAAGSPARAIAIDTAALQFTPKTAELTSFAARIGNSDVRATGSLDNLLGFLLRNDDLRGSATVNSTHFDLDEWKSKEKTTAVIPVPAHVDFSLNASATRVTYGVLTFANVHGLLHVKDQRVTIEGMQLETLHGTVVANGVYETTVANRPTFDVDLRLAAVDIPSAFAALTTVQAIAPIARWAQGGVSGTVGLKGPLGSDMAPILTALTGKGAIETDRLVMSGAPVLEKLADALKLDQLRQPSLSGVKAFYDLADGRLHLKPFVVKVNGIDMTVDGSNGFDQSLAYNLSLAVPRTLLGAAASDVVAKLAAQQGAAATALNAGEVVQLGATVTGTVTNPAIKANFAGMASSMRDAAQNALQTQVTTKTAAVKQTVDSAVESARLRARAKADTIVAAAERQAATVRAQARTAATTIRQEGNARADSLLARATNPIAKITAEAAADRLRHEADQQADKLIREADARADGLVAAAKKQGDALVPPKQ
jgi:hypothetical protein